MESLLYINESPKIWHKGDNQKDQQYEQGKVVGYVVHIIKTREENIDLELIMMCWARF